MLCVAPHASANHGNHTCYSSRVLLNSCIPLLAAGLQLGLDDIAEGRPVPWYRRWAFWGRLLSLSISLAFFLSGVVLLVISPDTVSCLVDAFRWA